MPAMAGAIKGANERDKQLLNKMMQVLSSRDGRYVIDVVNDNRFRAGHTIFQEWLPRVVKATFEDELADIEDFKLIRSGLFNLFLCGIDGSIFSLPVSRNYFDNTSYDDSRLHVCGRKRQPQLFAAGRSESWPHR